MQPPTTTSLNTISDGKRQRNHKTVHLLFGFHFKAETLSDRRDQISNLMLLRRLKVRVDRDAEYRLGTAFGYRKVALLVSHIA